MRLELANPGIQIFPWISQILHHDNSIDAAKNLYNVFITAHGVIMIFFMVMPALIGGFGNWFVPLMIGAPDMAFPRMNNISFWLLPASFLLLVLSDVLRGRPAHRLRRRLGSLSAALVDTGHPGPAMDFDPGAAHRRVSPRSSARSTSSPRSSTCARLGMTLHKMPLFAWSVLVTAFLLRAVAAGARRRHHHAADGPQLRHDFFDPAGGGDPILFQHLFWFFGHPRSTS